MTKTPEQLAEEFASEYVTDPGYILSKAGFLAGYKAAAPQWISVDKQLPELEIQCIWIDVRCIALNAMAARNVDDCEMWWNNYTHWMPLPKSPEE